MLSFKALSLSSIIALNALALNSLNAKPHNFAEAKSVLSKFYAKHQNLDETFYCHAPFRAIHKGKKISFKILPSQNYKPRHAITKKGTTNKRAWKVEWEHLMPAENFGKHLACWKEGGRKACQKDPIFREMEADLHNLVPSVGEVNGDRNNYKYAESPKGMRYTQYGNCQVYTDFKNKRFYPANYSKGQIARAELYMSKTYHINLGKAELKLMQAWDKMYPKSKVEIEREELFQ
ncbi:endonuclease [Helicobacter cetorum]|uniref:endonuclease n=1 Tax=Helicobacter cetorum TaxID=138563 RepID=UPI000CF09F0D|nr:endonuclease [Helicobacter cetorum]